VLPHRVHLQHAFTHAWCCLSCITCAVRIALHGAPYTSSVQCTHFVLPVMHYLCRHLRWAYCPAGYFEPLQCAIYAHTLYCLSCITCAVICAGRIALQGAVYTSSVLCTHFVLPAIHNLCRPLCCQLPQPGIFVQTVQLAMCTMSNSFHVIQSSVLHCSCSLCHAL